MTKKRNGWIFIKFGELVEEELIKFWNARLVLAHLLLATNKTGGIYTVSKNVSRLSCCNLDIHDLNMMIFGRSVTEKVRNQNMLCFPTSPI